MSDNVATDITGSGELITNGDFSGGTTGWSTNGTSIITDQGGYIRVDRNGGSSANQCYQDITTVVGATYMVRAKVIAANNQFASIYHPGGETKSTTAATADVLTSSFVATGTTSRIELAATGGSTITADFDDVSVMLAVDDRSGNFQSIPVYGSITRQAVNTNTDLVAFGPFSTSNYMEAPYNDDLDFGTGDFTVQGWIKVTASTSVQTLFHRRRYASNNNTIEIGVNTDETFYFYTGGTSTALTGDPMKADSWQHFACVRDNNVLQLYIDGQLVRTATGGPDDVSHPDNHTRIGAYINNTGTVSYPWLGKLALLKVSGQKTTASEVAKIFNDEKLMFEPNAKATLYWDGVVSDALKNRITGLSYDPMTERVHAGTESGRSEFQGLIRVNNSTEAVATGISARDGMVAEE